MTSSPRAALFDLDGTLLRGESQFSFLLWCVRRGVVPRVHAIPIIARYASYLTGLSRDALKLRESGFRLLRGIAVERLEDAAGEFFHARLEDGFRRQARPLIEAHRVKGDLIVLLTSACSLVAKRVAATLEVDVVIATQLLSSEGRFTGKRELPEPYGDGKRVLVERLCHERMLSAHDCVAYTDHHSDVSLLELVGVPIAVNPTPKLRAIAVERGWLQADLDANELPNLPTNGEAR